jgi:hypothetical protein
MHSNQTEALANWVALHHRNLTTIHYPNMVAAVAAASSVALAVTGRD